MGNESHSAYTLEDQKFCFDILLRDKHTVSVVLNELVEPLRTTSCVLYALLRCLDIIEDDTTLDLPRKMEALAAFPSQFNELDTSFMQMIRQNLQPGCKEHYVELLENFDKVWRVYNNHCTRSDKETIRRIMMKMVEGMMKYSNQSIESIPDYNEYCYYVCGVLVSGMTELCQSHGYLNPTALTDDRIRRLAVATGALIQKTDILRDTYEDMKPPVEQFFYPKEVCAKYVGDVRNLIDENYQPQAINCINHLINDACQHLPESIEYLSLLSEEFALRMTAIPLLYSTALLEKMFNNPAVLSSTVSLTAIERLSIFGGVTDVASCVTLMETFLSKLLKRMDSLNLSFVGTKNWVLESLNFIANFRSQRLGGAGIRGNINIEFVN